MYRLSSTSSVLCIHELGSPSSPPGSTLHDYIPLAKRPFLSSCWSHDGSCLASTVEHSDKIVLTYAKRNVFTSAEMSTHLKRPSCVLFSRTTQKKLILSSGATLSLFDVARKKSIKDYSLASPITCLSCSHNDAFVAAGCADGALHLVNAMTNVVGAALRVEGALPAPLSCLRHSRSRKSLLASSSDSGAVTLWDCNANAPLKSFSEHVSPSTGVALSPVNDALVLSCGLDKKCVCYDANSRRPVNTIRTEHPLTCVEPLPDGRTVALGTTSGKVLIYDLASFARPVQVIDSAHSSAVKSVLCQPRPEDKPFGGLKTSKSRSKLSAKVSMSNMMKENVPEPPTAATTPVPPPPIPSSSSSNNTTSTPESSATLGTGVAASSGRDSFSSQIFSPLRDTDALSAVSPALSQRSSVHLAAAHTSSSNLSHDSLFSPLREHSVNSPASLSSVSNTFPKTPISSFNKSINSPLVSPLTMIHEEDLSPAENEIFLKPVRQTLVSSDASDSGTQQSGSAQSTIQAKQAESQETLATVASGNSFRSNTNIVASTPFTNGFRMKTPENASSGEDNSTARSAPPEPSSEIRDVMTAFPRAFLEARAADAVDAKVLNPAGGAAATAKKSELTDFQQEYLRSCVEEAMEDHCADFRAHLWHMQYDMVRSFQAQKEEMKDLLKVYAVNEELAQEVERLRSENEELKKYF